MQNYFVVIKPDNSIQVVHEVKDTDTCILSHNDICSRLPKAVQTDETLSAVAALAALTATTLAAQKNLPAISKTAAPNITTIKKLLCSPLQEDFCSARPYNCLRAANIDYIYDLVRVLGELKDYRGMGKKHIAEITTNLQKKGLTKEILSLVSLQLSAETKKIGANTLSSVKELKTLSPVTELAKLTSDFSSLPIGDFLQPSYLVHQQFDKLLKNRADKDKAYDLLKKITQAVSDFEGCELRKFIKGLSAL